MVHARTGILGKQLLICVLLLAVWIAPATSAQELRPNIVVILCDDLGYGDLECFGHPFIKTPNLNGLALGGIRLTNCYSAAPVCSPSRVGLLTGRSPNRAGVYDWIPAAQSAQPDARDQVHMRTHEVTIPKLLTAAGYATCMSGKWHCNAKFNSPDQPQPSDAGFQHWFGTQNNASPSHENPRNYVRNGTEVGPLTGYSCLLAAHEASEWIKTQVASQPSQPFFLYLAFHEPHEPVASPAELVNKYRPVAENDDQAQFFANVENMDQAVGNLLQVLEQTGVRENTLIVFTSDNGPETLNRYRGAQRSYGRPGPLRGMKLWTTDGGFRVAGILNWPAKINADQTSDQVVSSLDLLPTFCELAQAEVPTSLELDGVSITPMLNGQEVQRHKPLLWCYYNALNEQRVAMRYGPWKMLAKLDAGGLPAAQNVFSGNSSSILNATLSEFELYNVDQDVGESRNIVNEETAAGTLREMMIREYEQLIKDSYVWPASP
ncbi:MAG: sulfatase-like hydrolase/transferase [Planctomycetales bacterium]|nr:sulfatase-like hydrolase/transferase [Planctomycetales bacterium]